jgi:hypothetical protein
LSGCCECGDEPSGSGDTELVSLLVCTYILTCLRRVNEVVFTNSRSGARCISPVAPGTASAVPVGCTRVLEMKRMLKAEAGPFRLQPVSLSELPCVSCTWRWSPVACGTARHGFSAAGYHGVSRRFFYSQRHSRRTSSLVLYVGLCRGMRVLCSYPDCCFISHAGTILVPI